MPRRKDEQCERLSLWDLSFFREHYAFSGNPVLTFLFFLEIAAFMGFTFHYLFFENHLSYLFQDAAALAFALTYMLTCMHSYRLNRDEEGGWVYLFECTHVFLITSAAIWFGVAHHTPEHELKKEVAAFVFGGLSLTWGFLWAIRLARISRREVTCKLVSQSGGEGPEIEKAPLKGPASV